MNDNLGSRQGSKHAAPDLTNDINTLVESLRRERVYEVQPGRIIPGDKAEVPNVVEKGLIMLAKPLVEFNAEFRKQQIRRRRTPLVGESHLPQSSTAGLASQTDPSTSILNLYSVSMAT